MVGAVSYQDWHMIFTGPYQSWVYNLAKWGTAWALGVVSFIAYAWWDMKRHERKG